MKTAKALALAVLVAIGGRAYSQTKSPATPQTDSICANKIITEADCTAARLGTSIPIAAIGEPVSAVTLSAPQWHNETKANPAHCSIEGSMAPVDQSPSAKCIRFGVALPASWSYRAAQLGGSGMNGFIPNLTGVAGRSAGTFLQRGFATYGSDSGHQGGGFGRGPAGPPDPAANDWTTEVFRSASDGAQLKREKLRRGRRRQDDPGAADSEHI